MRRILRIKPKLSKSAHERTPRAPQKGTSRKMRVASSSQSPATHSKARKGRNTRHQEQLATARKVATRKQTLTWAGGFLWKSLLLVVVAAMLGSGFYFLKKGVLNWSDLRVKSIEINGLTHAHRSDVLSAMDLEIGDAWLWSRMGNRERALRALPFIAEAKVTRRFPSRIVIDVKEADPVAITQWGSWVALYADGSVFEGPSWFDADLPIVEAALELAPRRRKEICGYLGRVRAEKPATFARFSQILPSQGGDLTVILRDGQAQVMLDPMVKSLNSIDFLESLLREHAQTWRAGANIDLRVANHAYVL
jgi:POTRA domain, FtsQ-type